MLPLEIADGELELSMVIVCRLRQGEANKSEVVVKRASSAVPVFATATASDDNYDEICWEL